MTRLFFRLSKPFSRRPRLACALWVLAVTLLSFFCVRHMRITLSLHDLLGHGDKAADAATHIAENYASSDRLIVLLTPETPNSATQTELNSVTQEIRQALLESTELQAYNASPAPSLESATEDFVKANLQNGIIAHLSEENFYVLLTRLTEEHINQTMQRHAMRIRSAGAAGARMSRELLQDPLDMRQLLPKPQKSNQNTSANNPFSTIYLQGTSPATETDYSVEVVKIAKQVISPIIAKYPHISCDYTGPYALAETSSKLVRADAIKGSIISGALVLLTALVLTRSPIALALLIASTSVAIICAFGVYGILFKYRLSPVAAMSGAMLMGLGVDYGLHTLAHLRRPHNQHMARRIIKSTWGHIGPALIAALVTSLIGFSVIALSKPPALKQLAFIGITGLILCTATALSLLCAVWLCGWRWIKPVKTRLPIGKWLEKPATKPMPYLATALTLCLIAGIALICRPPKFSSDLYSLHPKPNPVIETEIHWQELTGQQQGQLIACIEVSDPEELIEKTANAVELLESTGCLRCISLAQIFPPQSLYQNRQQQLPMSGADAAEQLRQAAKDAGLSPLAVADACTRLEQWLDHQPAQMSSLNNVPQLEQNFLPKEGDIGSYTETLVLAAPTNNWKHREIREQDLKAILATCENVPYITLTGSDLLISQMRRQVEKGLTSSMGLAAIGVAIWLLIFFRSIKHAICAMAPAICGLGAALLWSVTAMPQLGGLSGLDTVSLAAFPLIIGIGVDDGIFLVHAARHAHTLKGFIRECAHAGWAITLTTLTSFVGFISLNASSIPAIRSLGQLVAIGILTAWIATVVIVIPILAMKFKTQTSN